MPDVYRSDDGGLVVRPQASPWKLKEGERTLFEESETIPNWRLADKARRLVLDLSYFFSPFVSEYEGTPLRDLRVEVAQQIAILSLGNLTVRSAGSGMMLVSTGYVPESAGPIRRCVEANLRARAILDDESGEHARAFLQGKPKKSISQLAHRYGKSEDLKLLSVYAHSDVRGLMPMLTGPPEGEDGIDLRPNRDDASAAPLLHAIAYECAFMSISFGLVFQAAIKFPAWVQAELARLKDVIAELNRRHKPEREAAATSL